MTVEAIRLRNFMAFKDTEWIHLRPITLVFGRNSSGKSALIRALLLLKLSLKATDNGIPLRFASPYGPDYGGFKELIHAGDDTNNLWFYFRCSSGDIQTILARLELPTRSGSEDASPHWILQLGLGYAAMGSDETNPDLSRVGFSDLTISAVASDGSSEILLFATGLMRLNKDEQYEGDWFLAGSLVDRAVPGSWLGFGCFVERNFLDIRFKEPDGGAPDGYDVLEDVYRALNTEVVAFLDSIIHLGPIRPEPQRRYSFDRRTEIEWKEHDWTDFLDFLGGKLSQTEYEKLDLWLRRLGLAERAASRAITETAELVAEYEVGVYETDQSPARPLSAMGFGTSQVLPVIVHCVRAKPGSLVIIEQPELHLHPRAQAALGDLYASLVHEEIDTPATSFTGNSYPRFLLETHSEHLILRFQSMIRKRHLAPHALEVLYITRHSGISYKHELRLDEEGDFIDAWPEGFFEEDFAEVFGAVIGD